MKLKYQIAMLGVGVLLILLPLLLRRRPRFIREFFAAETEPINLAVFRVIFFVALAFSFSVSNTAWFGSIPPELQFAPQGLYWLVKNLPISEAAAWWAASLMLVCCFAAAFGLFTRVSAILCVILGFYVLGIPQFYGKINHYHHLLWFAAILAVSPCADVLSIDAIFSSWKRADAGVTDPPRRSVVYALPLRFVWLVMGAIYFSAGFWKVWTGGYKWAFSDNPKIMMYNKWLELGGWRPLFRIDQYPFLYEASAAATIVFELSFIVIIFFPAIRVLAPLGGLVFHNMTNLFMRISFWNLQICYAAFVDWDRAFRFLGKRLFKKELYLFYDGNCELCRRTVASIRTLDVFRRVSYLNGLDEEAKNRNGFDWLDSNELLQNMCAVIGKKTWVGFEAYRALSKRIPITWPILPLLYVWPITVIGNRYYRHIADSRTCSIVSGQQSVNLSRVRTKRQVFAIGLVGGVILYAAILSAVGKIQSWPLAGYPTFEDLDAPEIAVITITVEEPSGRTREIDPVREQSVGDLPPERLLALLGRILSVPNNDERDKLLRAFWTLWSREDEELKQARVVRFYKNTLSTLPERQNDNLIDRKLLYEMRSSDSAK
jgi:predicted DCC family thiol-disulfide oxidoreductase YuxK